MLVEDVNDDWMLFQKQIMQTEEPSADGLEDQESAPSSLDSPSQLQAVQTEVREGADEMSTQIIENQ